MSRLSRVLLAVCWFASLAAAYLVAIDASSRSQASDGLESRSRTQTDRAGGGGASSAAAAHIQARQSVSTDSASRASASRSTATGSLAPIGGTEGMKRESGRDDATRPLAQEGLFASGSGPMPLRAVAAARPATEGRAGEGPSLRGARAEAGMAEQRGSAGSRERPSGDRVVPPYGGGGSHVEGARNEARLGPVSIAGHVIDGDSVVSTPGSAADLRRMQRQSTDANSIP